MTSQGSPYSRFERALATGSLTLISAAAAELPRITLRDALRICRAVSERDGDAFERAAVRWIGRFCHEHRAIGLEEVAAAAAAFREMPARPDDAAAELAALIARRG
jgi:hypothetical protein